MRSIGRVTEGLLANISKHVDVIEPTAKFTAVLEGKPGVRNIYTMGMEDWYPAQRGIEACETPGCVVSGLAGWPEDAYREEVTGASDETIDDGLYDLVWLQWCVGHLTDDQLVRYLERCKTVLRPQTGLFVVKENITRTGEDHFEEVDSHVTRCDFPGRASPALRTDNGASPTRAANMANDTAGETRSL